MTPCVDTPRGGLRLFVGRCILCRGRRVYFLTSRSGSICFGGADTTGVCFFNDPTDLDVVFKSNAPAARPRVPHELPAAECFHRLEPFERKQLLKSCTTKGRTGPPPTLGRAWRVMATNTSVETGPLRASRRTTGESWGKLSPRGRPPHPETTSTSSVRPRTAMATKPLPRDTAPHASKPVSAQKGELLKPAVMCVIAEESQQKPSGESTLSARTGLLRQSM